MKVKLDSYYLGINSSHDASACLLKGNMLLAAVEEERLNKDKHSVCLKISNEGKLIKILPFLSISYVLQEAGIRLDEVDKIVVTDCDCFGYSTIIKAEKLLRMSFPIKDKKKIIFIPPSYHHLLHAYNAYYFSPFKEAIILVVDAFVMDDERKKRVFESIFYAKDNRIEEIYCRPCQKGEMGLGAFFQFFCKLLNFDIKLAGSITNNYFGLGHDESGKLMGLAAHGRKYFTDNIVKKKDGFLSIRVRDLYEFGLKYSLVKEIAHPNYLDEIEMAPNQRLLMPSKTLRNYRKKFAQDLAYFAQKQLEKAMFILVDTADKIRRVNNLCISGGVALNCQASGRIKERYKNKSIYIPFAPADNGNAIGACFYAYCLNKKSKKKYIFNNLSPFLGKVYKNNGKQLLLAACRAGLDINNLFLERLSRNELAETIAEFLCHDIVVAFFAGGSEFGPRALGHRSILANPLKEETKKYLNQFIKKREWFRPFAPIVLSSHKDIYFETVGIKDSHMSFAVKLKSKFFHLLAIKSADDTSRIQIISSKEDLLLVDIIKQFGKRTGIYLLLNTSCNIKGFPIIEEPQEILYLYKQMPVDAIVIEDILVIPHYDIFKEFLRYRENKLDNNSKERLADRLYAIKHYYRAKNIYKELFAIKKDASFLLQIFKSLLCMSPSNELYQTAVQLKSKKTLFFNRRYGKNDYRDYRIYMGLYELCYSRKNSVSFEFNKFIRSQSKGRNKGVVMAECLEYISKLMAQSGGKKVLSVLKGDGRGFLSLLKAKRPDMVNN